MSNSTGGVTTRFVVTTGIDDARKRDAEGISVDGETRRSGTRRETQTAAPETAATDTTVRLIPRDVIAVFHIEPMY